MTAQRDQETTQAFSHVQVGGKYYCDVNREVYGAVLLLETGTYCCLGCGAAVVVPTCGGEGE